MNALILASAAWLAVPSAPLLAAPNVRAATVYAQPDELRRERVPADVDFVVHFDFESFKQTQVWKHIAATLEREELEAELDDLHKLQERFGIDPLRDVRALTLFKIEGQEEPTVVLFSTTLVIDAALKKFQAEPGYARISAAGIELHTWSEGADDNAGGADNNAGGADNTDKVYAYLHAGANDERVVVLASNEVSAVHAARVLRGQDPSHASAGSLLTLAPARGSFLYAAAKNIPHLEDTPASQVFGLAQGLQVDLGEAGGYLRAHIGLMAASAEKAIDISNLVNGLISLARLAGAELGEALELLTGIRLTTRGNEVVFDFEFEVARLVEIVQSLEELDELHEHDDEAEKIQQPQEREGGKRRIK